MNRLISRCLVGAGACLLAAPAFAGTVSTSVGADYTSGKYGYSTSTDIWMVPLKVGYTEGPWRFELTLPYIHVSGVADVIPGVGAVANTNPQGRGRGTGVTTPTPTPQVVTTGSASGLGDIVASAGYQLVYDEQQRFGLDATARVKFGTADETKGLGTGKNDYTFDLDAYKGVGDWTVFGGLGYTNYGSSTYIRLKDGMHANVGAGYKLGADDNVGAYYYYRERISDTGYKRSEVTAYWNHHFGKQMRLQIYALTGFTKGSPDWGGGAMLKWSF